MERYKEEKQADILIEKLKGIARKSIKRRNYEKALAAIASCANILYEYNQIYSDDELEDLLLVIGRNVMDISFGNHISEEARKVILFYDGFGLDTRGIALEYVKIIAQNGYRLIYVTTSRAKNKQPTMFKELRTYNIEWIYIDMEKSYLAWINSLAMQFQIFSPSSAFFYTTPYDVAGTVVFNVYKGLIFRYLLDLTDHAFWLGKNAFDICIGGRNFSASIEHFYRGIPKEKLVKLDVSLYINSDIKYEGLPFDTNRYRFIFSGGALYKTLGDTENKFYRIVEHILKEHNDVVFVYAGKGDTTQLDILKSKYKGRVYHFSERSDFYEIMKRCVFYLNTYPMFGGLMMRYAANAGKIPVTLKHNNDSDGILINQKNLGIEYLSFDDLVQDVDRLLTQTRYLKEREEQLKDAVMTEASFSRNVRKLIEEKKTEFIYDFEWIDTSMFVSEYKKRFNYEKVLLMSVGKRINFSIAINFPWQFLKKIILTLGKKLQK